MFLASATKPIDDVLKNAVEKIEAQSSGLSVLAARQFRYNLRQNTVELNIKEPRQFNVLEEFIIRAGIEFEPPPTADELASVLGLDSVFVKSTIATLQTLQTLAVASQITVTSEGRSFYEKGTVPQPPYSVQVYAISDPLGGNISFQSESLNDATVNLPDLAKYVNFNHKFSDISSLSLEELQQKLLESDLGLHLPEEGKVVTSFRVLSPTQSLWKTISLFVIFDALEDKLSIQLRQGKRILEAASNWLEALQNEGKISLQALCELSNETINFEREAILNQKNAVRESRLEKIRQMALEIAQDNLPVITIIHEVETNKIPPTPLNKGSKDKTKSNEIPPTPLNKGGKDKTKSNEIPPTPVNNGGEEKRGKEEGGEEKSDVMTGTAVQLRDGQIAEAFSEVLNSAKRQILIYSPWVSQAVVDDKFLSLLQQLVSRGVGILIGHGIARRREDEERLIPPEIEAKLKAVKTPEGLPGVQVFWLGDSHVKEVIVDQKIHLCGSHNWLSYRGDYLPRGESVYQVTIPAQVQEAYQFLAERCQNHAQELWSNAVENRDFQLAVESLCIWGALAMEDVALTAIQQHNWLELLPVWLNVVLQGLRSNNIPGDSASLKTALSLLSQVGVEAAFIEPLGRGWRQVFCLIAINNRETALNLLSNDVWAQFLRLNIAQESDSPDKFISPPPAPQKPGKKKTEIKKRGGD
ncbi:hypothetical protein Cylst_3513 [Cylindrospermum stagnale PCC 7417]|uniref:PLD phosphodiesterase domain-containing protein n=1 Tax=Cylindrospermum stagnale PCC 7417 TaxID=56107 RepID=K9WZM6_9NOST|nr:hypothetical protein [Cylindrospermum stagnale]AFZ25653.1 hypothetical protein Cylst_3513 [Cylindrospermum stagnale PCC 7417]